jgi:HAD superfamily hydrolase (TIGR01549 family)
MKIEAIIFDMDGTITQPYLDFDRIRAEMGGLEGPILEAMEKMSAEQRNRAEAVLERHEQEAVENSSLNPSVVEVLEFLRATGRKAGLITRNNRSNVERVSQMHGLHFDAVFTRDDGPAKPHPFSIEKVCEQLSVNPERVLMVGDHLFDLICGRQAGAVSVLLSTAEKYKEYVHEADFLIHDLGELMGIVKKLEKDAGS